MKTMRLNSLFLLLALAGLTVFSSCNNDDNGNGEPEPNKPNLKFFGGEYISEDATINAGDTAEFSWQATKGDEDLKRFAITKGGAGTVFDSSELSDNNAESYTDEFAMHLTESGEHTFTFEIWDEKDRKTSKSITVTVRENAQLNSYSAILMGAQNNTNHGSFYSTSQNKVYFATGFDKSNDIYVDFIYYHGSTNKHTVAGPTDPTVEEFNAYDVESWDDRNNTRFMAINKTFADLSTGSDLAEFRGSLEGSTQTKTNTVSVGDVFAFITETGKLGAYKVDEINGTKSGSIKISVKIQP